MRQNGQSRAQPQWVLCPCWYNHILPTPPVPFPNLGIFFSLWGGIPSELFPPYIRRKAWGSSQHLPPPPRQMQTVFHVSRDHSSSTRVSHADLNPDWQWVNADRHRTWVRTVFTVFGMFIYPSQVTLSCFFISLFYYTESLWELLYRQHVSTVFAASLSPLSPILIPLLNVRNEKHLMGVLIINSIYPVWCGFKKQMLVAVTRSPSLATWLYCAGLTLCSSQICWCVQCGAESVGHQLVQVK